MRTSNPLLSDRTFKPTAWEEMVKARSDGTPSVRPNVMTLQGAINKSAILITICIAAAGGAWYLIDAGTVSPGPLWIGGALLGLVLAMVAGFAPKTAPVVGPIYAVVEGAFLGAVSIVIAGTLEKKMPGLGGTTIAQAVGLTFGIFAFMLAGYATGFLRLGSLGKKIVMGGTMAVALLYLVSFIANIGFGASIPYIHSSGPIGIGFSVLVIALASFNLSLDFDFIATASAEGNQPKYMEWLAAIGLLATLVWLYIEILRLLSKLRRE